MFTINYVTFGLTSLTVINLLAVIIFACSFAGFRDGEWPMRTVCSCSVVFWGIYLLLSAYAWHRLNEARYQCQELPRNKNEELEGRTIIIRSLAWTHNLLMTAAVLFIVTGIGVAFGSLPSCGPLWIPPMFHWGSLLGTFLSFSFWFALPFVARDELLQNSSSNTATTSDEGDSFQSNKHLKTTKWWKPILVGLIVVILWGLVWFIGWILLRDGPMDESVYPDPSTSPYVLPFPGGETSWLIKGNNNKYFQHYGWQRYSWDFRRECGSPMLASRGGTVLSVRDDLTGRGNENNYINIDHGDGTHGKYLHLQQSSAKVKRGDVVEQGAHIANVGNVGISFTQHIHFSVEDDTWNSIPITFRDVLNDKGIPRAFKTYTSGNTVF